MSFFQKQTACSARRLNLHRLHRMAADAADALPLDITNANRNSLEHNMSNEVPPPANAPFILSKKAI